LFAAVCGDWKRAERELFHLNVRSGLRTVGRKSSLPKNNSDISCRGEDLLA
jgi:hypothetical protein